MKKLIMAIAVVACAAVASAASFDWKTSATGKIYEAGTETLLASGTAYIFDANAVSQQTLVEYFVANGSLMTGSLDEKSIAAGVIKATSAEAFAWSNGDTLDAYFAVVVDDKIFVSATASKEALDTGYSQFSFNAKTASQAAATEFSAGSTVSAGWYTAAAVPEPTSGLLMLVGLAGLALRRRRA